MKNQRLAPWCTISWDEHRATFKRVRSGGELYTFPSVAFSDGLKSLAEKKFPFLAWSEWYQLSQTMDEAVEIKALRNFLSEHALVLDAVTANIWSLHKAATLELPPVSDWYGFSKFVAIVADPDHGYWLEVPGASCSLWAEQAETLSHLLGADLSNDLKKILADYGFDGRALSVELRQSSTLQDWLWWESARMLDRLGPLSHTSTQANSGLNIPKGVALEKSVAAPTIQSNRVSVREHETRQALTHEQLLNVLNPVFAHTEGKVSPWHGMVYRNPGASGGGAWEESAWVWVNQVQDLTAGLYRFDGHKRCLVRYELSEARREGWIHQSKKAWGREHAPQAVVAVVADFTKLPSKYFRLSQQLAHLNTGLRVGELLHTAEAMGLASCALGGGVMKDLALQLELNPLLFGSVCEVALGGLA